MNRIFASRMRCPGDDLPRRLQLAHKQRQARLAFLKPVVRKAKPKLIQIINGKQADRRNIAEVKRDWLFVATPEVSPQYSVNQIQESVALHFRISKAELVGESHSRKYVWPRFIAIYLASKLTSYSSSRIGRLFEGRDHTTILNARKKVARQQLDDPVFAQKLEEIEQIICDDQIKKDVQGRDNQQFMMEKCA